MNRSPYKIFPQQNYCLYIPGVPSVSSGSFGVLHFLCCLSHLSHLGHSKKVKLSAEAQDNQQCWRTSRVILSSPVRVFKTQNLASEWAHSACPHMHQIWKLWDFFAGSDIHLSFDERLKTRNSCWKRLLETIHPWEHEKFAITVGYAIWQHTEANWCNQLNWTSWNLLSLIFFSFCPKWSAHFFPMVTCQPIFVWKAKKTPTQPATRLDTNSSKLIQSLSSARQQIWKWQQYRNGNQSEQKRWFTMQIWVDFFEERDGALSTWHAIGPSDLLFRGRIFNGTDEGWNIHSLCPVIYPYTDRKGMGYVIWLCAMKTVFLCWQCMQPQCRVRKGAGSQSVVSVCQHTAGSQSVVSVCQHTLGGQQQQGFL